MQKASNLWLNFIEKTAFFHLTFIENANRKIDGIVIITSALL